MSALRTILSAIAESMAPDGTMVKMRFRVTLDMLTTLAVTVLAIGLGIGYQVLGRRGARGSSRTD